MSLHRVFPQPICRRFWNPLHVRRFRGRHTHRSATGRPPRAAFPPRPTCSISSASRVPATTPSASSSGARRSIRSCPLRPAQAVPDDATAGGLGDSGADGALDRSHVRAVGHPVFRDGPHRRHRHRQRCPALPPGGPIRRDRRRRSRHDVERLRRHDRGGASDRPGRPPAGVPRLPDTGAAGAGRLPALRPHLGLRRQYDASDAAPGARLAGRTSVHPGPHRVGWGDSRMSNVLYGHDLAPVAALDWRSPTSGIRAPTWPGC